MRVALAVLLVLIVGLLPSEGNEYPKNYFRSPVGIPIRLSGSFAEMRSNHFHSGLDIRTNARTGYKVYAAAEGWVSRINVSPSGFGNALYIDHPNGYTTVYGHLERFSEKIQAIVKAEQYRQEKFAVEIYPKKNEIPVDKGRVVAFSGNSGSSGGPHLHFDIRDAKTQWPINPWLFGLAIPDQNRPVIRNVKIYPLDEESYAEVRFTDGKVRFVSEDDPLRIPVTGSNGRYNLSSVREIVAHGQLGFGIEQRDTHTGSRMRLGAYTIRLLQDSEPIFGYEMEKFSFSHSRYINGHVDFREWRQNNRWMQRSYIQPGQFQLPIYRDVVNDGIVYVQEGDDIEMTYEVKDVPGNTSRLRFKLKGGEERSFRLSTSHYDFTLLHDEPTELEDDGIALSFKAGTFYDDVLFSMDNLGARKKGYSDVFRVHDDELTAVHKYYSIALKANDLPESLEDKAIIGEVLDSGRVTSIGGKFEEDWVTARTRSFGTFFVTVDTTAPSVSFLKPTRRRRANPTALNLRVRDNLTGISSFAGYVDDEWVLFEYDRKRNLMKHTFDGRIKKGTHELYFVATDGVGNTKELSVSFKR